MAAYPIKMESVNKGAKKNERSVIIDGKNYRSMQDACKSLDVNLHVLRKRLYDRKDLKAFYVGFPKDKPLYE